jgi:hypothetical protein
VARWFPLGISRKSVVTDPARSFGRPITSAGIPTEVLNKAVIVEGSIAKFVQLYNVSTAEVLVTAIHVLPRGKDVDARDVREDALRALARA